MDKLINKHIDDIEELERQMDIVIDKEISSIDIDALIKDPQGTIAQSAENMREVFLDEYADKAVEFGFDFGRAINKKIEQDKTIKIDKSKDPELNA